MITIASTDINVNSLSFIKPISIPSIAFLESLTDINKMGNKIGKLSTAIKAVLLLALDTIPDTKVRTPENPMDAKKYR